MKTASTLINAIIALIDTITDVENVYGRRVVYEDSEEFVKRFQISDKSYLGFQVYRAGVDSAQTSFYNKVRRTHTMKVKGIIGVVENAKTNYISYDHLQDIMQDIAEKLSENLKLSSNVTLALFPSIGDITYETAIGKLFWACEITWVLYEDEVIQRNIS